MSSSNNPPTGMNHFISLNKAINMTTLYRAEKENILVPELKDKNVLLKCETFDRVAFDALLAQQGCVGIRTYFGMTESLQVRVIAVGVNAQNEDMLPSPNSMTTGDGDDNIVEEGQPCPELCPPPSPLN